MDDLISRQAAIDAVAEGLKRTFVEYRDAAEKMLNKVPSAQPEKRTEERTETHWIPVTEATPTEEDDYWCTFDAETGRFVDWCSWYQGRWVVWTDNTVSEVRNVIAWCKPLEPYKGVTDGRN